MAIIHATIFDSLALAQLVLAQDDAPSGSGLASFVPIVVIFAAFYFLIIRPGSKRKAEQAKLIRSVAVGDEIVTIGGFHGGIVGLDDDTADVEIAEGVIVTIARTAIARTLNVGPEDERLDDGFDDTEFDDASDGALDGTAPAPDASGSSTINPDAIDPDAINPDAINLGKDDDGR